MIFFTPLFCISLFSVVKRKSFHYEVMCLLCTYELELYRFPLKSSIAKFNKVLLRTAEVAQDQSLVLLWCDGCASMADSVSYGGREKPGCSTDLVMSQSIIQHLQRREGRRTLRSFVTAKARSAMCGCRRKRYAQ